MKIDAIKSLSIKLSINTNPKYIDVYWLKVSLGNKNTVLEKIDKNYAYIFTEEQLKNITDRKDSLNHL
tara:strand:+ start:1959 stop:2162 length:204 start_codon:yes stop_codon:yes gene_type:complete